MKYFLKYGLNGGFNAFDCIVDEYNTLEEAERDAWFFACEEYESYAGSNGLRDTEDIMSDDGVDNDEAIEIFEQEREDWLEYYAELYDPKKHDDILNDR